MAGGPSDRGSDDPAGDWPPDVDYAQLLLVALVITVAVAVGWAASTSTTAFGAYNPAWDGASDLSDEAAAAGSEAVVATEMAAYADAPPNGTTAVILSPDSPYTDAESARLRQFLQAGGTLIVAEDFGPHSNPLLVDLGVETRVDGRLVRDEHDYYRTPNLTVATGVTDHPLTRDASRLTLNHGTVLRPGEARVLVRTGRYAYLDGNRNADLDETESMGRYPVATVESVGEGWVVVVSDPSLFVNAMLDRRGNRAFVRAAFAGQSTVLLDLTHAERVPPLAAALLALRRTPWLLSVVGLLAVGGVVAVGSRPGLIRSVLARGAEDTPSPPADRVRRGIAARHPDWEESRTGRLLAGLMTGEELSREDE